MKHNKYVEHQDVKMYCATNQFPGLQFLGTHNKPHGVRGLGKNYHMNFDTKLGNDTCDICNTPCAFPPCKFILGQTWDPGITEHQQ